MYVLLPENELSHRARSKHSQHRKCEAAIAWAARLLRECAPQRLHATADFKERFLTAELS